MTRKDYEAIAAAIKATPDRYMTPLQTKQEIASKLAALRNWLKSRLSELIEFLRVILSRI